MTQFDHDAVKGTDVDGDQELEDETVQDVVEDEGLAKVSETAEAAPEPS